MSNMNGRGNAPNHIRQTTLVGGAMWTKNTPSSHFEQVNCTS
jgi:hypothetical protein